MKWQLLICLALATGSLVAKEPVYPPTERFEPGEAIQELARQRDIPLTGIQSDKERVSPKAGDQCSVLVSMCQDDDIEQWLITFKVSELSAAEAAQIKETTPRPLELFSSTGGHYVFQSQPLAVDIWVAGPLNLDDQRIGRAIERVKEQRARFLVNAEYLSLGLDRAAMTIMQLRDNSGKVGIGVRGEPFPEAEVLANRERLEARGITANEERAMVGAVPALTEFFRIAAQTPGLKDILMEVIDIPWWALIKEMGNMNVNFNLDGKRLRMAAETEAHFIMPLGIELNRKPALLVEIEAGTPQAPASVLAGVTAVFAGKPKGTGKRVSVQLLAARTEAVPDED